MENIVELKDLSFGYKKDLLKNVNLKIKSGEFVGITGDNGEGKTTLLKLILGQLKPDSGQVILGENSDKNVSIGYLEQRLAEKNMSFSITPEEIISLNLYDEMGFFKIPSKKINSKVNNALSMVKMCEKKDYDFNNMSGGEKQRILIAKELVDNPQVLIFDEPTAGIDSDSKKILFGILEHLNKFHGITILVVTHEMEFCKPYFSRVLRVKDQRVVDVL
ncbi:ATP-binding cassette domain-containing protein [Lagierella sp.]|uniref:metal ABC transporter ATP-binding protein n=1 Tax=Lagierella sp. TaxID=2849657 RepID=UPI002611A877|nr:ATP-binding cassette domain-containing protein [Lagierella sp.]